MKQKEIPLLDTFASTDTHWATSTLSNGTTFFYCKFVSSVSSILHVSLGDRRFTPRAPSGLASNSTAATDARIHLDGCPIAPSIVVAAPSFCTTDCHVCTVLEEYGTRGLSTSICHCTSQRRLQWSWRRKQRHECHSDCGSSGDSKRSFQTADFLESTRPTHCH
jgi:hypothetical protein